MQTVAVIDYGMGNLHSVAKALDDLAAGEGDLTKRVGLNSKDEIGDMAAHWRTLLAGVVANPECAISELPMLAAHEIEATLYGLNATQQHYPGPECVHQHIEAQAAATPEACALVFAGQSLSYRELNQRANRLAGGVCGDSALRRGLCPAQQLGPARRVVSRSAGQRGELVVE